MPARLEKTLSRATSSLDPWSAISDGRLVSSIRAHLQSGDAPKLVEFYISDRCALRCKHCFHGAVYSKTPAFDLNDWRVAIEQFVELGTKRLHFAGREPFLSPDLLPLLRWLAAHKERRSLSVGAITDGFSCAPLLQELQQGAMLDYLDISIDGARSDHDKLRGRGTYDRSLRVLERLISSFPELCLSISSVLYPENSPNVISFMEDLHGHGVKRFYFQPIQPLGFARETKLLTPSELRGLVMRIRDEFEAGRLMHKGLTAMIFIPVEYLPDVAAGDEWLEERLSECLHQGDSSVVIKGNKLILNFEIMRVPFNNHLIVSHDGYILARFGFRSVPDYDSFSPGNLRLESARDLLAKGRAMTLSSMGLSGMPTGFNSDGLRILQ